MAQTTVEQFAAELGLPTSLLLEQLKSAGVSKSAVEDKLEEVDKTALLEYLRKEHGAVQVPKNKITLTRKSNTEIKKTDSMGKARTIQVEVRKKRVLVRNEEAEAEEVQAAAVEEVLEAPLPVEAPLVEAAPAEVNVPLLETVVAVIAEVPAAPEVVEVEKKPTTLKKQV